MLLRRGGSIKRQRGVCSSTSPSFQRKSHLALKPQHCEAQPSVEITSKVSFLFNGNARSFVDGSAYPSIQCTSFGSDHGNHRPWSAK